MTSQHLNRLAEEEKEEKRLQIARNAELYQKAHVVITKILKDMNGLSEEGFENRIHSDPFFKHGYDALVELYVESRKGAV